MGVELTNLLWEGRRQCRFLILFSGFSPRETEIVGLHGGISKKLRSASAHRSGNPILPRAGEGH